MAVNSPFMFFGSPFLPHSLAYDQEAQLELAHLTLEPVLKLVRDIGCTLVTEGIQDKHPAPLLALVRSFATDLVRMSLDIGHAMITNRLGGPPTPLQFAVQERDQWWHQLGGMRRHHALCVWRTFDEHERFRLQGTTIQIERVMVPEQPVAGTMRDQQGRGGNRMYECRGWPASPAQWQP